MRLCNRLKLGRAPLSIIALALAGAILSANAANAQDSERRGHETHRERDGEREEITLVEIVVTAQKREENLQKTALAVSAVSGEALDRTGTVDPQGLTDLVPGVEVGQNNSNTTFAIRGISSTTDATLGDAAVAFHLDGVFEGRPTAASGLFYDLQRVEVLRGPQGTLYGRNATAGAINVVTNHPSFDGYHADAMVEIGNYAETRTEAMFNAPITDTFAVRGAAQTLRHNAYLNSGYDDADDHAVRLQALWRPTDAISLLLFGDFFHQGGIGAGYTELTRVTDGSPNYNPIPQRYGPWPSWTTTLPLIAIAGAGYVSPNGWSDNESWSVHAELNWDLGPVVLTEIPAYHRLRVNFFAYGNGLDNLQDDHEREISNELRLSSAAGSRIKWVAGLFYHDEEQPYQQQFYDNVGPAPFNPCFNGSATYLGECTSLRFVYPTISNPSYAAFGQLTFPVTSDWRVTGGVRWNRDHKHVVGGTYRVFGDEGTGGAPTFTSFGNTYPTNTTALAIATNADVTWQKVTWKAGVEHDLTDSNLLYANVSTGYKQGGVFAGAYPNTYKPETLTAYEIGSKNRFMNNRVQVNADVFYYKYKDYQVDQLENLCVLPLVAGACPNNSYGFGDDIFNAARASEFGAELETRTLVTDADEVGLNVAYLHAKFDEFQFPLQGDARNPSGTVLFTSLAGATPTSAPELTGTFSYRHTWDLSGGSSLAWMLQTHAESAYWLAVDHNTDPLKEIGSRQRGYTRSQTSITYSTPQKKFSFQAWVRNIENKAVMTYFSYGGGGTPPYGSVTPPRTYGVTVAGHF